MRRQAFLPAAAPGIAATVRAPLPARKLSAPHSAARGGVFVFALFCGFSPPFRGIPMALRPNLQPGEFLLSLPDEAGRIALPELFGNDHPVELEIGSGKGTFLLAVAEAAPERNFIGIEYARAYAEFAA